MPSENTCITVLLSRSSIKTECGTGGMVK